MPDLDQLAGFDPGTPAPLLPPSEVRRRGDRRRRRTTARVAAGAALAAAVAVGTPVALLSGHGDGHQVEPAPSPPRITEHTDPGPGWVTTVPADFPLTAGFPATNGDGTPTLVESAIGGRIELCGANVLDTGQAVAESRVAYVGESEDQGSRTLVLYPDDRAAESALATIRDGVAACDREPIGDHLALVRNPLSVDLSTDESYVFAQRVWNTAEQPTLKSELTVHEIARTGNALLLMSSYGSAGDDGLLSSEPKRLMNAATAPLETMCLFAEHPCLISHEPASAASSGPPSS